jgi:hypothetical protein
VALVICSTVLFVHGAVAAQNYGLQLTSFTVYDAAHAAPANQGPTSFDWHQTSQLAATTVFELSGQFKDVQKLKVFLVVKDGANNVVFKSSQDYWVYPGTHRYEFNPLLETSDYFGTQQFTVELEANMKGFEPLKRSLSLSLSGPPVPQVVLDDFRLTGSDGHARDIFGPAEAFTLATRFKISGNELHKPLQLVLVADEAPGPSPQDYQSVSNGVPADSSLVFNLPAGANGHWRLNADGAAPECFADWSNQYHPVRIYALLRLNKTVLAGEDRLAAFFDPRPAAARHGRNNDRRNCSLQTATRWTSRQD